jgi:DNA mismatch repair protein MutS2
MKLFPATADHQLEFDRIKEWLGRYCQSEYAKKKATELRVHTRKEYIGLALRQSYEFKQLVQHQQSLPNDHVLNLTRQLSLLSIPGAVLIGEDFLDIRKLAESIEKIFRWFNEERKAAYPGLFVCIQDTWYEKQIIEWIDEVLDERGQVKDNASVTLKEIRQKLYKRRQELRRLFDKIVSRLQKQGYLAEIEESFLNGRRVVAVTAEQKRTVKGILHGESDSRKTAFIEPEETIELNNHVYELENEERKEVYRLLQVLTGQLSVHAGLLSTYHDILGEYDFIRAKAKLAMDYQGEYPLVEDRSGVKLVEARHPLLLMHNQAQHKPTIPVSITLDDSQRILLISGPNAGGKTVTMKTLGLLQLMVQSGLLVPVHPSSIFGIFKQLMIHIGDTQSIEFELSTYSSHLLHMKHFMEEGNGRTLFFIDELGSGSDPSLGGAFAEVILLELLKKHCIGIVTTHYLNLKIMAGRTAGIVNGAMSFDEKNLRPLYQLVIGKPGSSYTFAIAERIGMRPDLIAVARKLVDEDQYRLDKLLNRTEQDLRKIDEQKKLLQQSLQQYDKLKKEMERTLEAERHRQQVELLREQNRVAEEKLTQLKDLDRKIKQLLVDWRKTEDKSKVMRQMEVVLFNRGEKQAVSKIKKRVQSKFIEIEGAIQTGLLAMMKTSHQVGEVLEIRGKKATVKIGQLPMQVAITDLVLVKKRDLGA